VDGERAVEECAAGGTGKPGAVACESGWAVPGAKEQWRLRHFFAAVMEVAER